MTDWNALAKARGLDIPDDSVKNIAPSMTALDEAFRPLLGKLSPDVEPAIILSESAVIGE